MNKRGSFPPELEKSLAQVGGLRFLPKFEVRGFSRRLSISLVQ